MTKETKNVSIIETTMLPVLVKDIEIELIDGQYHLSNYSEMVKTLKTFQKQVDNYQYDDADRQPIKKIKTAANKTIKQFKQNVKEQQEKLFGPALKESKEIETLMTKLSTSLAKGLDEDDKNQKKLKKQELTALFKDAKDIIENLSDLDFDFKDIYDISWLNRTASHNKVVSALNQRLETINLLVSNPVLQNNPVDEIIEILDDNDWDGLKAQNELVSLNQKRQEELLNAQLLAEAKRQQELKKQEEEILASKETIIENTDVNVQTVDIEKMVEAKKLIKINISDFERAKKLLHAAKIEFEEVL